MLLREYMLLNLGRTSLAEARRWQGEMAGRRRLDACRDILAFWRPRQEERQVVGFALFHPHRFTGALTLPAFQAGLEQALREALPGGQGRLECREEDGLLLGELYLELPAEVPAGRVTNAIAYYTEQAFGFAPAAIHPVAYEEQMRPQSRP